MAFLPLTVDAGDLGRELELHALLLEDLGRFLADFAVHAGEQLVEEFDHRDLGAEPPPDQPSSSPITPPPITTRCFGHLGQLERAGGIDDDALGVVDLDAGQRRDRGAGGDDDVLRGDRLAADLDGVRVLEGGAGP